MKKIYCSFAILALLISCSASKNDEIPVTPNEEGTENKQSVGPFKIEFNPNTNSYEHSLDIPINQSEGYFEYNFIAPTRQTLRLKSAVATFTGCDQSAPVFEIFWLPNPQDKALFAKLAPNKKFSSIANVQSQMLFNFKKIDGCKTLKLTMSLEKLSSNPHIGKDCDSNISNCKVLVACTEPGVTSYFYETEVWNHSGSLYLKKFLNRGDGTRSLQTSALARQNSTTRKYIFSSNDNRSELSIDIISSDSIFKDSVNGSTYTHVQTCDL